MAAATWNPSDKGEDVTLSNANRDAAITASGGDYDSVRATVSKTSGKWYWEVLAVSTSGMSSVAGIANSTHAVNSTGSQFVGSTTNSVGWGDSGNVIRNGVAIGVAGSWTDGDVLGFALDKDANTLALYKNGSLVYTVASGNMPSGAIFPCVGTAGGGGTMRGNFASSDWTHSAPSGFSELSDLLNFELTMTGGVAVGGEAVLSGSNHLMTGGVTVGGGATFEFAIALDHTMTGGVKVGGGATISFTRATAHDLSDEGVPNGGFTMGGAAIVQEAIQFVPVGGMVLGGSAVVQDNIPVIASGGAQMGGDATILFVASPVVSGGAQMGGSATITYKPTIIGDGGASLGGEATVRYRQSLHVPTGGMTLGGEAVAFFLPAGALPTTENPYAERFPGWALNLENNALSRYLGLPANSIAQLAGRTFVTNAGGVYEMRAKVSDAGADIEASVQWPTTDYGTSLEKRMEISYFGLKTEGTMRLMVRATGNAPVYVPVVPSGDYTKGAVARIGKGLKGRFWATRLDNVGGAYFELDSAEFIPHAGQRRGA